MDFVGLNKAKEDLVLVMGLETLSVQSSWND
jgi:hypothetical protein